MGSRELRETAMGYFQPTRYQAIARLAGVTVHEVRRFMSIERQNDTLDWVNGSTDQYVARVIRATPDVYR